MTRISIAATDKILPKKQEVMSLLHGLNGSSRITFKFRSVLIRLIR
jgi:hypothetical protein